MAKVVLNVGDFNPNISIAIETYINRRDRIEHPNGTFDSSKRWTPALGEAQPCCATIRQPSRAFPLSLNKHCRSLPHIAAMYGLDKTLLRKAVRLVRD